MVQSFIEHFTYAGIFLVLFAAGLGLPIPEEGPVLAAGVLAQEQIIRWWIALPVCLAGVLSGDIVLYWVGHHWGEHILDWRITRRILTREREESLKAAYRRHGVKIVFTARHVMGLRAAAFLTAGITHVPFVKFLVVDFVAALIGVPVGFGIAFLFADQLESVLADVHRVERWLAIYALVGVAGWLAWLAWRQSRRSQFVAGPDGDAEDGLREHAGVGPREPETHPHPPVRERPVRRRRSG
jgi:membrane protein DedA with SNARE-associated domain